MMSPTLRNTRPTSPLRPSNDPTSDQLTQRTEVTVAADDPTEESESGRPESTDGLWAELRIDPVEIALPGGVGYTLRAYRSSDELSPAEVDPDSIELDDFDAASAAVARRRRSYLVDEDGESLEVDTDDADLEDTRPAPARARAGSAKTDDEDEDDKDLDDEDLEDEEEDEDEEDEDDDEAAAEPEEVPIFLGRNGKVYLFHNPEKLVEFVRSGADNDLAQLDTWSELAKRVTVDDIVALDEDSYELDLVVENLRGGADAWDAALLLKAGEVARDLGYALRLDSVLGALGSGSPLDDLDEALRSATGGGVGAFFAKRKLRKIPAQQTSLAWRTVIGKIAAAADWRD